MSSFSSNDYNSLYEDYYDEMPLGTYNFIIGFMIFYGMALNAIIVYFCGPAMQEVNMFIFFLLYFISISLSLKMAESSQAATSFIAYNILVLPIGLLLARYLPNYYIEDIYKSFMIASCIVILSTLVSSIFPALFAELGKSLFIFACITIITELILYFLGLKTNIIDFILVGIFSLYVGYHWTRAQDGPFYLNNAVDAAFYIYLDIINLFIKILGLSSKSSRHYRG